MNTYTVGRSSAQGGTLCCGRVGYFVSCHTLCVVVPHTLVQSVVGLVTGANGSSSPSIGRSLRTQGHKICFIQTLIQGLYGHKISSEKTLRQWNSIYTAGTGQKKPEVKIGWNIWLPQDFIYFSSDGKDVGLRFKA